MLVAEALWPSAHLLDALADPSIRIVTLTITEKAYLRNAAGELDATHPGIVADLATPGMDFAPSDMVLRIVSAQVDRLERAIDALNEPLSPLKSFILPGGSEAAARVHLARAICRRAERSAVTAAASMPVNPAAIIYLNRLSDLLFVLARAINADGAGDILWVPGAQRQG